MAAAFAASASALAGGLEPLTIRTGAGDHVFRVARASTPGERSKGLMFRRSLDADEGMLFDFDEPQPVSMWMRNTYISLDMLFAGEDGVIHNIAARTEPFSEAIIEAGAPTRYVLEVKGGTARLLGISPGDRMIIPGD